MNEKETNPISTKFLKNKKIICIIGLIIIFIVIVPLLFYYVEIIPHVNNEVNAFEANISNISDPQILIRELANYTENNYYQAYNHNPTVSILGFDIFGDSDQIRIRPRLFFANDPYFIAFFKTGACGESADLLNFIANKSGLESRIVGTQGEDHQWVEIKINGSWVQVDPTIYYYYYTEPERYPSYKDYWFDNPLAYSRIGWYEGGYSSVSVVETHEDLSTKYVNASNLSISCHGCDHIQIIPVGRRITVDQDIQDNVTLTLGKMNYTILADKPIIPYFLVNEKNVTISLTKDTVVNITSAPEELKTTILTQFLFVIFICVILIVAIILGILKVIDFFKNWKNVRSKLQTEPDETNEQK